MSILFPPHVSLTDVLFSRVSVMFRGGGGGGGIQIYLALFSLAREVLQRTDCFDTSQNAICLVLTFDTAFS